MIVTPASWVLRRYATSAERGYASACRHRDCGRRQAEGEKPEISKTGVLRSTILYLHTAVCLAVSPVYAELTDYSEAYRQAQRESKILLIACFTDPQNSLAEQWRRWVREEDVARRLSQGYVQAVLSKESPVPDGQGGTISFIRHPAFRHLHGRSGIVMIDLADPESPGFRQVVFVYPFQGRKHHLTLPKLRASLRLPAGTLTQRMLIFAVRVHPERPRSTDSRTHPVLMRAAESHSLHQARINLQGHHNWESRFHQLNAQLGSGLTVTEVCAESWPGETLVEAAHECVHSWRQSSGHWSAVAAPNRFYGYDMKRGSRGVWYGTGIFAK